MIFFTLITDDRRLAPHFHECMPQTRLYNSGVLCGISAELRISVSLATVTCSGVPFTVNDMAINTKSKIAGINKCLPFIFASMCMTLVLSLSSKCALLDDCGAILRANGALLNEMFLFISFFPRQQTILE